VDARSPGRSLGLGPGGGREGLPATRKGEVFVFAAGREKKLLHTVQLGAPVSATPTAANGVLYLATMTHLYAFRAD